MIYKCIISRIHFVQDDRNYEAQAANIHQMTYNDLEK